MIGSLNSMSLRKLNSYECVDDVEDEGMDEGRFFVHLTEQYEYPHPYQGQRTKSFGSFREANQMLKKVVKIA